MTIHSFSILMLLFSAGIAEASGADEPNQSAGFLGLQTTGRGRTVETPAVPPLDLTPPPTLPAADLVAAHAEERSWYGVQLIVSDLVSAGMVAGAIAIAGQSCTGLLCGLSNAVPGVALGSLGVLGLTIVAPITHLAHGQGLAAAESVALRILLPLAAGLIAAQAVHQRVDFYGTGSLNAPMVVGAIALGVGAIIDDAVLSSDPGRTPVPAESR